MSNKTKQRKNQRRRDPSYGDGLTEHVRREMMLANGQQKILSRRLTRLDALATTGSGVVTGVTMTSTNVTACAGFAEMQGLFGEFRVRAIRLTIHPALYVNNTAYTPAVGYVVANFVADRSYTIVGAALDGAEAKYSASLVKCVQSADWHLNQNAKLWTPQNDSIPVDNQFGIQIIDSGAGAGQVSTTFACIVTEFLTEWKSFA